MIKAILQGKVTSVGVENLTIDGMESVIVRMDVTGVIESAGKDKLLADTAYKGKRVSYVWKPMLDNGKSNYGYGIVFGLLTLEEKRHLRERIAELKAEGTSVSNAELMRAWAATDVLNDYLKDRVVTIEHKTTLSNGKTYEDFEPRFQDKDVTEADALAMIIATRRAPKAQVSTEDVDI